jgi:hypothetical protein
MGPADEQQGRTGEKPLLRELLDQRDLTAPILVTLRCECGERSCTTSIVLALDEYAEIRADSTLSIVAPDHLPELHELVYERPQFDVVRIGDRAPGAHAVELQSRLIAIREVIEREGQALARRHDENVIEVLVAIEELKLSIATALGWLQSPMR